MPTNTTITIQRATSVSDGSGGKTATLGNVVTGVAASRRLYTTDASRKRMEAGAGAREAVDTLFVVKPTFPDVRVNDVVKDEADGTLHKVHHVRTYTRTMQLDTERVS